MKGKLQSNGNDKFTTWFFYIVAIAAVVGAFYTFFVVGIPKPTTLYSVFILKPDSYSHYADNNTTSFSFTIRNVEGADAIYDVRYLANGIEVDREQLSVAAGEEKEFGRAFNFGDNFTYPIKVEVWAETNGKTYSIFYWLKENR